MATLILVTCNRCKAVHQLQPGGVRLTVYDNDRSFYEFFCLTCRELQTRPADHANQTLLVANLVPCSYIHVPREVSEIEGATGPAITNDNIMDFVKDLRAVADVVLEAQVASPA